MSEQQCVYFDLRPLNAIKKENDIKFNLNICYSSDLSLLQKNENNEPLCIQTFSYNFAQSSINIMNNFFKKINGKIDFYLLVYFDNKSNQLFIDAVFENENDKNIFEAVYDMVFENCTIQ